MHSRYLHEKIDCFDLSHYGDLRSLLIVRCCRDLLLASAFVVRSNLSPSGGPNPSRSRFGLTDRYCDSLANVVTAQGYSPRSM